MKLHNTRTRRVDEFKPRTGQRAYIYSCGPTVYDHVHIGNLSAFIYADMIRRAVVSAGYDVVHGMNYTDVDDKMIRRSQERFPELEPMIALQKLAAEYADAFLHDMALVGNDVTALSFLRATDPEVLQAMRDLITKLHQQGFAYIADDGVYFSIDAYRKSGKQYGQLLTLTAGNTAEARIQNDEYDKESAHDFALWKKRKDREPAWEFTLAGHDLTGRPGWHIECSVMSRQLLGQPFDIHTGGVDLIFPHHENEIAQSTATETDPVMAQFFTHNEHMFIGGEKMSKSLGNFYTLNEVVDKGYDPLAFRILVLQSHYRHQAHFDWTNLQAAQNRLVNYRAMADLRWQLPQLDAAKTTSAPAPVQTSELESSLAAIKAALQNDVDTPAALAELSRIEELIITRLLAAETLDAFGHFLASIDELLGLQLLQTADITPEQQRLLAAREQTRLAKDWPASDKLRETLQSQGIGIRDTECGGIWYRI